MRIKEFVKLLEEYDEDIEIVIKTPDGYASPKVKKDIVKYKHEYSGTEFIDDAIILFE